MRDEDFKRGAPLAVGVSLSQIRFPIKRASSREVTRTWLECPVTLCLQWPCVHSAAAVMHDTGVMYTPDVACCHIVPSLLRGMALVRYMARTSFILSVATNDHANV